VTDTSTWAYRRSVTRDGHTRQQLTRGIVRVVDATDDGITREQLQGIADEVWALSEKYPPANPGKVTITVKPDAEFEHEPGGPGYVAGSTAAFTADIELNERTLVDGSTSSRNTMPVSQRVPEWVYTVAHEYGHAFTPRDLVDSGDGMTIRPAFLKQWWTSVVSAGDMSAYGESDPVEGYAEAFAEWSLTHGSTSNRAARRYGRRYAWAV
jgi:hypothetical protein